MIELSQPGEVWLLTGSQFLYGEQVLREVQGHSQEIAGSMIDASEIPLKVLCKNILKTPEEILQVCAEANNDTRCVGVIAWMHTFSPAKMWIGGLRILNKPLLHLHTQFNRDIPWKTIDMDFMNLNQSAHGDREFGFIMSRMRLNRKVVAGHWKDPKVLSRVGAWTRAARAWSDWQGAKFCRIGDNMREVAVTEGDKVEAQIQFGFAVNGYGVGDLVATIRDVAEEEVSSLAMEYEERYDVVKSLRKGGDRHQSLLEAAKIEAGLRTFLKSRNAKGFTDTFEDLHGLLQLPGIAVQRLMNDGYGFGAEGDWKTSALVRAMKVMGEGMPGGNSFMEDYTYHLEPSEECVLGSHMLEICESVAVKRPRCEIHPLGIGGKADPVRLVFDVSAGPALNASLIDMGNRFRMLINEVEALGPVHDTPQLPVARVLWKPLPDFYTASEAWILAGGAHHTCYSQNLSGEDLENFAEMAGVECVRIGSRTTIREFKNELRWNERYYSN